METTSTPGRRSMRLRVGATVGPTTQSSPPTSQPSSDESPSVHQAHQQAVGLAGRNADIGNLAMPADTSNGPQPKLTSGVLRSELGKRKATDDPPSSPVKPKKRRLKAGSMKMVGEMPYEILLEILSYALEPEDLYNLSRASSALHALLLSKSLAPPLWEAAFKRMSDLPSCPLGLILPAYAELIYGRACHYCPSKRGLTSIWKCHVRLCSKCLKANFMEIPTRHRKTLWSLLPLQQLKNKKKGWLFNCLKANYERALSAMESMSGDPQRWEKHVEEAMADVAVREQFHDAMRRQEDTKKHKKETELEGVRKARKDAIIVKLHELGYQPENITGGYGIWHSGGKAFDDAPGVNVGKPLTDKEWAKIGPKVIAFCHEHLAKDRTKILSEVYDHFLILHPTIRDEAPLVLEVAKMEPFRTVIWDTPATQGVTQADVTPHLGQLPELIETWRGNVCAGLVDLVRQGLRAEGCGGGDAGAAVVDASVLDLATTVFTCKLCSRPLFFPKLLNHTCFSANESKSKKELHKGEIQDKALYDPVGSKHAAAVVRALGEPLTVTGKEMDTHNSRVECVRCRINLRLKPKRLVMSWRQAIIHERHEHGHLGEESCLEGWKGVDETVLVAALSKEDHSDGEPGPVYI